jgi:hypothetical protein
MGKGVGSGFRFRAEVLTGGIGMAYTVFYERFTNIYSFMDTIAARPNNGYFGTDSKSPGEWSGTKTWDIAVNQFQNGIPEKAEKLKKSLDAFKANSNINAVKRKPTNHYFGYTPNVPAAIIGLPKSMRRVERVPQKVKALSIVYDMTQNSMTSAGTLERAGETVLQLVYALECRGYRVALDGLTFNSERDTRRFVLIINLKDWKQHLDIMKLSFPVTSPAMFRRFGFAWAETLAGVKSRVSGYGSHMGKSATREVLEQQHYDIKNSYLVTVNDCSAANFDALALATNIGII